MSVRQALVPASLLTSVLDGSLLAVDVRPLVVHVLHGLESAGIERAVVVLGVGAEQLVDTLKAERFRLTIDFIWGVAMEWGSSLANNVMAARAAFQNDEPLLVVRSDYLFDWRLLRRMVQCTFDKTTSAFALIDSAAETLEWVSGAHCKAYCKDGHCHALVKVFRGEGDRIARIGHRLSAYDALQAGIYVTRAHSLFDELSRMLQSSKFCSVADAMQAFADVGRLRFVEVEELTCNVAWFGHEIMQTALTAHHNEQIDERTPAANRASVTAALALLFGPLEGDVADAGGGGGGGPGRMVPSPVARPSDGRRSASMPLYALGEAIGAGANGVVMDAVLRGGAGGTGGGAGGGTTRLRVPVVRKGQSTMSKVMWEAHVLRQLSGSGSPHAHIVKLLDVVDVVDACYLIMERVDGPTLSRCISEQPRGVLLEPMAQRLFAQLLSALRHAHRAGFVHCDIKPENVRLHAGTAPGCEHAVLLDWGYARRLGPQAEPITQGSPAYAAPEQLTGYRADGVSASDRASLTGTVDVWGLGATLCEMLSGAPPFGGATFDQLVGNVLALNVLASVALVPAAPRELVDAMLQILPCDRATVEELVRHPWVTSSGALPDEDEVGIQLLCDECDDGGSTAAGKLRQLLPASMADLILCGKGSSAAEAARAWRRRLLFIVYGGLCAFALLSFQAQGGIGGVETVDYLHHPDGG